MAMTRPLTLKMAGVMILAELRTMALLTLTVAMARTDWLAFWTDDGYE